MKRNRVVNRTLLRYIFSFLLVLVLPLCSFFVLYNKYFLSIYQDEVFERYHTEIENLERETEIHVQWMRTAAAQFTNQYTFRREDIEEDVPHYSRMFNVLNSIAVSQDFFSGISFYSSDFPDMIFTNFGTYNIHYYKKYKFDDGEYTDINGIGGKTITEQWFTPSQIRMPYGNEGGQYEFIVPVPHIPGDYVIFSIPKQSIRSLADADDFLILDRSGEVLFTSFEAGNEVIEKVRYASEPFAHLEDGRMLFCRKSADTGLVLAMIVPEETLLLPVRTMQRLFLLFFLLLTIIGGIVVFGMALLNYHPIHKLMEAARLRVNDIPQELQDISAVGYVLKNMEHQIMDFQESARMERTILKLIYGRIAEEGTMDEDLRAIGLPLSAQGYRAVIVYNHQQPKEVITEALNKTVDSCKLVGMEYLTGACFLFIMGGDTKEETLRRPLEEAAAYMACQTGQNVQIVAGGSFADPKDIRHSFRQAVQNQKAALEGTCVSFCRETETVEFYYPSLDLQSFYHAIIQMNAQKFSLITEMLLDTVRSDAARSFASCALCCDMINISLSAMRELQPHSQELIKMYSCLRWEMEPGRLIETAERICGEALALISRVSSSDMIPKDSIFWVIQYINENYDKEDMNVSHVADVFGLSASNLSHRFKSQTGTNISDYVNEKRMGYAKSLLSDTTLTVTEIAARLGYTQTTSFIRKFKAQVGIAPSEYRSIHSQAEPVPCQCPAKKED